MAKIVLKTAKRSTTVKRMEVRNAVSNAFQRHHASKRSATRPSAAKKAA